MAEVKHRQGILRPKAHTKKARKKNFFILCEYDAKNGTLVAEFQLNFVDLTAQLITSLLCLIMLRLEKKKTVKTEDVLGHIGCVSPSNCKFIKLDDASEKKKKDICKQIKKASRADDFSHGQQRTGTKKKFKYFGKCD